MRERLIVSPVRLKWIDPPSLSWLATVNGVSAPNHDGLCALHSNSGPFCDASAPRMSGGASEIAARASEMAARCGSRPLPSRSDARQPSVVSNHLRRRAAMFRARASRNSDRAAIRGAERSRLHTELPYKASHFPVDAHTPRKHVQSEGRVYRFGPFELDSSRRVAKRGAERVARSIRALDVLSISKTRLGKGFSPDASSFALEFAHLFYTDMSLGPASREGNMARALTWPRDAPAVIRTLATKRSSGHRQRHATVPTAARSDRRFDDGFEPRRSRRL